VLTYTNTGCIYTYLLSKDRESEKKCISKWILASPSVTYPYTHIHSHTP